MLSFATPTLVGPLITTVVIAAVAATFGPIEGLLGGRVSNAIFYLLITGPPALLLGILMLGLDVIWCRLALQPPVTGWPAWIAGLLAPIPVQIGWEVLRPGGFTGVGFWFAVLVPVVLTAFAVRVAVWFFALAS